MSDDELQRMVETLSKTLETLKAGERLRFVETKAEAKAATDRTVVIPTLRLTENIKPLVDELSSLADFGEDLPVWRPIHTWRRLRPLRARLKVLAPQVRAAIALCHERMGKGVEGGSAADNAWLQGYATSMGVSTLFQLQSAAQSLGEVIDRKDAYAIAVFSLYLSVFSIVLSVVLSLPSLL